MIEGISHEMLCHYVTTRQKIDTELQIIYSLSHLLASFGEKAVDANLELDLDDFIYLVEARQHIKK